MLPDSANATHNDRGQRSRFNLRNSRPGSTARPRLLRGELEQQQNLVRMEALFAPANTPISKALSLHNSGMKKRAPILEVARSSCLVHLRESAIALLSGYSTPRQYHRSAH